MADGKTTRLKTEFQLQASQTFRQVVFMDRFKCSYKEYMETPIDFINDAITIINLIAEKENQRNRKQQRN